MYCTIVYAYLCLFTSQVLAVTCYHYYDYCSFRLLIISTVLLLLLVSQNLFAAQVHHGTVYLNQTFDVRTVL